jgi:hypothetical protein
MALLHIKPRLVQHIKVSDYTHKVLPPSHILPFSFFRFSVSLFFVTMPIRHSLVSPSERSSTSVLDPENVKGVSLRRDSRSLYSEPPSRQTAGARPTIAFDGPANNPKCFPQLWRTACASQTPPGPVLRDPDRGTSNHHYLNAYYGSELRGRIRGIRPGEFFVRCFSTILHRMELFDE